MPLGMLRRPEPENVEEAGARLASLDDDGRVHQRREILRALEAPDVAILHLEEETALGSAQTSLKAQGTAAAVTARDIRRSRRPMRKRKSI